MSTSPAASPRPQAPAPQQQPSANKGLTRWNVIFTPGGSSIIKDNLVRVYENREYRIYGVYLTGLTALRSGLEILPSIGILLINTVTWFVDFTSPRGDGIAIFTRDFADVIHCIKTAIALPFFALAGLIFPKDVFKLFENMPGIQTKVEILNENTVLAKALARREMVDKDIDGAEAELDEVRKELEGFNAARTSTKAEVEAGLQQIEASKEAVAEAARLKTVASDLTSTVARLRDQEKTATASLEILRNDIKRLGDELKDGKESNSSTLASLERERVTKQEELQRIENQIKQAGEKQTAAQAEVERLSAAVKDLTPIAAALKADFERFEAAKPGLLEREKALLATIKAHKDELQQLEAQVTAAKEKTSAELAALNQQIADQNTALNKSEATLERLGREQKALNDRRSRLDDQCRELEFTTLYNLTKLKATFEAEKESLEEQKAALGAEIAEQQALLHTQTEAAKTAAARAQELETTIAELEQSEVDYRDTVLPELEFQAKALEQRKAALEGEVSAKEKNRSEIILNCDETSKELEGVTRNLKAKQAEQASLEQILKTIQQALKGSPINSAAADGSASPDQTIAELQKKLAALGASISEATLKDAALRASVAAQESALQEKTQAVGRLTGESNHLETKVGELQTKEAEINAHLLRVNDEIKKLEGKEKVLKDRNAVLEKHVQISTESLEKIVTQHKELETQVHVAEKQKTAATKDYKTVSGQVIAAQREKSEIQGVIDGLKLNTESMRTALAALEAEKARLDGALPNLRTEEQSLARQITEAKQELTKLKETLAREQETHSAEMEKFEKARTQLTEEKNRLEVEQQSKLAARDALQSELVRLRVLTESLKGQETILKETVRAAEEAQQAAIARTTQEGDAFKKLQAQTLALSAKVQVLTQESSLKAEANQKLEAEFVARRAAFEEELRQREQGAVATLESRLQAIRMGSPAKAKLDSPARTPSSSVPLTPDDVAKLNHQKRELERTTKAAADRKAELAQIEQQGTAYKAKLQADLDRIKGETTAARAERDRLRAETRLLKGVPATPAKPAGANGGTATEAKQ